MQSEKLLLFDTVQSELEEKIRRLEEDRHSIDITSGRDLRYVAQKKRNATKKKKSPIESIFLCDSFHQSCGMTSSQGGERVATP